MEIRKCKTSDLDALDKFYYEVVYYLTQTINYPRWMLNVYPNRDSIKKAIDEGSQFAAYENGELVGAFVVNTDTAGDYTVGEWSVELSDGEYLVVHSLATHQRFYGNGIARKMMEFCLTYAKEKGFKAIRLDVVPDNFPAIKLYESLGFSFAGEKDLARGYEHIPTFCLYEINF